MRLRSSSGFTLMEVMIVVVLASVVTLGLVGFYLNSQATWLDASAQALAQRDATLIVESIATEVQAAESFDLLPMPPDNTNDMLLVYRGADETARFWWEPADSLIHKGLKDADYGPLASSIVERFQLSKDASPRLVHLDLLEVRSSTMQRVQMQSTFALYNAPTP